MKMIYELGQEKDIDEVEELYDKLNDYLIKHINYPGWKKDIYPIREDAVKGVEEKSLFVARINGIIAGTIILRHKSEPAYDKVKWQLHLDYAEIFVLHTFAVHPDYLKQGIGSEILDFVLEYSRKHKAKSVRLDVYTENMPAINLYEKKGFTYIDTVDLGYSSYGLENFKLYEKLL